MLERELLQHQAHSHSDKWLASHTDDVYFTQGQEAHPAPDDGSHDVHALGYKSKGFQSIAHPKVKAPLFDPGSQTPPLNLNKISGQKREGRHFKYSTYL